MSKYMTAGEAAAYLGVSPRTVSRLISRGELKPVSDPTDLRYRLLLRDDVERIAAISRERLHPSCSP